MGSPVGEARSNSIGAHGIDGLAGAAAGTVSFIVRTPDANMRVGGSSLAYEQSLGSSGNPDSVSYKLTANKEYTFTIGAQAQETFDSLGPGFGADVYKLFIYNDSLTTASYDIIITTR